MNNLIPTVPIESRWVPQGVESARDSAREGTLRGMSKVVRFLLLATIAVLFIQVVISIFSDTTGLVEKLVMLAVGLLLLFIATQVELKGAQKDS